MSRYALTVIAWAVSTGATAGPISTIEFYLSKSSLVVIGQVTQGSGASISEGVVHHYSPTIEVVDVLHGEAPATVMRVAVVRLADTGGIPKKGKKYILFLKESPPGNFPK